MKRRHFVWIYFVLCLLSSALFAQDNTRDAVASKNEFMIWGGGSPDSNVLIGSVQDARFGIAGVRYARIFKPSRNIALKYTVDAIPASVLSYPILAARPIGNGGFLIERVRESRFGMGISPFGLQINFRRQEKVQPFVSSSGGFVYFTKSVPTDLGVKFNFTADLSGGVQYKLRNKKAITFGYRYHHLSNAYRAVVNPGVDSNVFCDGFSVFK